MKKLISIAVTGIGAAVASAIAAGPAFAGNTVPGPVLGAGAPALAVIAGGYYLIRRYRRR